MNTYKEIPKFKEGTCVTIGKFDGVHLGHVSLLEELVLAAELNQMESVVFTFEPYPEEYFKGEEMLKINTKGEIVSQMDEIGVDNLIRVKFDEKFSSMEPTKFIKDVLVGKLCAKMIVCGPDVSYGKNGAGDVNLLNSMADKLGYEVIVVDKEVYQESAVSSSRIIKAIEEGNLEDANEMLGYDYYLYGPVVTGQRLGTTYDIPTVNINPTKGRVIPARGVYFTIVEVEDEEYQAVTNVGVRPTVSDENAVNIESHLLNCSSDADFYGKRIRVYFLHHSRGEIKFSSSDQLFEQIKKDVNDAKKFFESV